MGLADTIRSGVALADSLTASLQVTVSHEACTGKGNYNDPTFATAVSRLAIVNRVTKLIRKPNGQEVQATHYIAFLRPVTITEHDRITLPDGSTGPILSISGFVDKGTGSPFFAEVYLG